DNQKIAVEVKSFQGASDIHDLEQAVGQYVFYRSLLSRFDAQRKLYLAVPHPVLIGVLDEAIARPVLEDEDIAILTFDAEKEQIVQWTR
ncbi:MAG: fatty-acid oxidation protein subunit alpha, partial [Chloroflexi bacterium]